MYVVYCIHYVYCIHIHYICTQTVKRIMTNIVSPTQPSNHTYDNMYNSTFVDNLRSVYDLKRLKNLQIACSSNILKVFQCVTKEQSGSKLLKPNGYTARSSVRNLTRASWLIVAQNIQHMLNNNGGGRGGATMIF